MSENTFDTQEAQSPCIIIPTSQFGETELCYNEQLDHTAMKIAEILSVTEEGDKAYIREADEKQ